MTLLTLEMTAMSLLPPILLGVNIDHAATLRQARYRDAGRSCGSGVEPDPVLLALLAERAGADGITVHLREDRRHIQEEDLKRLRVSIQTRLNLEMACTDAMVDVALAIKPETVCLVPEGREEITTEGGLDVIKYRDRIGAVVDRLLSSKIGVSLFIEPDPALIAVAAELGVPLVELHTGAFAQAYLKPERDQSYRVLLQAAQYAASLGLTVNAGHGINYVNVAALRVVPEFHEFNIGHSILSRALFTGIEESVRKMKRLISR